MQHSCNIYVSLITLATLLTLCPPKIRKHFWHYAHATLWQHFWHYVPLRLTQHFWQYIYATLLQYYCNTTATPLVQYCNFVLQPFCNNPETIPQYFSKLNLTCFMAMFFLIINLFSAGIRQEQDIFVRLIDSATKTVRLIRKKKERTFSVHKSICGALVSKSVIRARYGGSR